MAGSGGGGGSSGAHAGQATGGSSGGTTAGGQAGASGSSANAGAAGADAGTCKPTYLLCEDFETTAPGQAPTGWTAHGMAAVAEDQAKSGKRSLKVSPQANGERRIYHDAKLLGAEHWGRVYYRVQTPAPSAFVHSTLVAFSGSGPTIGPAEYRVVDTVKMAGDASATHQFLYNVQPQNSDEFGSVTDYDWTFDGAWHCAEWHVKSADQSYAFYFEGSEEIAFSKGAGNFGGAELPDAFSDIKLGWNNYQSSPPGFTAWLDDLALDDERVGCLP